MTDRTATGSTTATGIAVGAGIPPSPAARHLPWIADVLRDAPALRVEPGARVAIRGANRAGGRRIAVLDDDPTGSQTVHDVDVVTVFDPAEYAAALAEPGSTCFILTNSRSLPADQAVALSSRVAGDLYRLAETFGGPVDVVSRGDSTLRGHVVAEVSAIRQAHREVTGRQIDGVLFVPAYFEAGRFTAGDIHWATVGGQPVPVGESEFAKDSTFGYRSSNLRDFIAEKSQEPTRDSGESDGGTPGAAVTSAPDVVSISLQDIRIGGPDRVAEILTGVRGGAFVVINATDYSDLEIVVLGLLAAREAGRTFIHRAGPSFVRALAGLEPQEPLTTEQIWAGRPQPGSHGLVVVGSHVGLTSRQVQVARDRGGLVEVELDVPTVVDPAARAAYLAATANTVVRSLFSSDVLLYTSRTLIRTADPQQSLAISREVSSALIEVVRAAMAAAPAWVIAKGGITSHDVAVRGLGIRRAKVMGQLLPGMVSVFEPVEADPTAVGVPYVVFAGNVGDENTLASVISVVGGKPVTPTGGGQ